MSARLRLLLGALVGALVLAGCGSGLPASSPPTGVDGLVVPTPSPDPADFVAGVDNPWLPLAQGARWRYAVSDGTELVVEVVGTAEVAGVEAVEVRALGWTGWFAQDRDGNVWLLGEEYADGSAPTAVSWRAGVDGARAGLAMPAEPRLGDGFVRRLAPDGSEERRRVVDLAGEASTPAGAFAGLLVLATGSSAEPTVEGRDLYAPGAGLVRSERPDGSVLELIEAG